MRPFSIILYSIFLPSKGKISFVQRVGGRHPSTRMVLLATRNGVPSKIRTVGGKTFSCVAGKSSGHGVVPAVDHTISRIRGGGKGVTPPMSCSFRSVVKDSGKLGRTITLTQGITSASIPILLANRANAKGRIFSRTVRCTDPHDRCPVVTVGYSTFDGSLLRDRLFNCGTKTFAKTVGSGPNLFRITGRNAIFLSRVNRVTFSLRTHLLHILRAKRCVGIKSAGPAGISMHVVSTAGHSLGGRVRGKRFHRSLCFHLSIFRVRLPPLHRQGRSVRVLTRAFLGHFTTGLGGRVGKVASRIISVLGKTR